MFVKYPEEYICRNSNEILKEKKGEFVFPNIKLGRKYSNWKSPENVIEETG